MIREPALSPVPRGDERDCIRDPQEARAYVRTRPSHERRALAGAVVWCRQWPLIRLPLNPPSRHV